MKTLRSAKSLTTFTTPPNQLHSRRRRQHNVGSPGYVMRNRPRPSLNPSMTAASPSKVLVLKLPKNFPAETWFKIIRKFEAHALIVFFTATPYRSDGQEVVNRPFVYHLPLGRAIANRIIRPTRWDELNQDSDNPDSDAVRRMILEKVKFVQDEKNRTQPLPGYVAHMAIAICKNTTAADEAVDMWNNLFGDHKAIAVHSGMQKHKVKKAMERIDSNDVELVVVVDMLQEGFDHPPISIAAILTKIVSPVKFVQFIGRAQRVVREGGDQESPEIHADIISHSYFEQNGNYARFTNEQLNI